MRLAASRLFILNILFFSLWLAAAAQDGVTAEQRAQIIADYERHKASAPQNTAPEAEAPSAQNNTRQYKDIYSPA